MRFFNDLLAVRTVWVDKGSGRWVRRRRLHPILSFLFWSGVLAIITLLSVKLWSFTRSDQLAPVPIASQRIERSLPTLESQGVQLLGEKVLADANTEESAESAHALEAIAQVSAALATPPPKPRNLSSHPTRPQLKSPIPTELKNYWIQINKSDYTLALLKGDQLIREYQIAVGRNPGDKQYVGDNRTPEGDFRVVSIENASSWSHDFRDGKGTIAGAYGPWFIRLSAKGWKGIGIHGTHDPDSLGTMATEGCVRMNNAELQELKRYAYRNMRVVVNP